MQQQRTRYYIDN